MSSETIPAPVTDPSTAGQNTGQAAPLKSALAAFIQPVEPVSTQLASTTESDTDAGEGDDAEKAASGSSAEYKSGDGDTGSDSDSTSSSGQPKSVVRAWLLAWAQRWGKGGGTANKRLELKKARAQARQIKTTETVNRSAAGLGSVLAAGRGGSNTPARKQASGNGADKGGAGKKTPAKQQPAGTNGRSGNGTPGRSTRGSGGTGSGSPNGRGSGKPEGNKQAKDLRKDTRKDAAGPKTPSKGTGGGTPGKGTGQGAGGSTGKDRKPGTGKTGQDVPKSTKQPRKPNEQQKRTPKGGTDKSGKDLKTADKNSTANPGKQPASVSPKSNTDTSKRRLPWRRTPKSPVNTKGPDDLNTPKVPGKAPAKKDDKAPAKKDDAAKPPEKSVDLNKKPKTSADDEKEPDQTKPDLKKPSDKDTKQPTRKLPTLPRRTQKARETGYRHGTTIGDAAAQAGAYRDGLKDGVRARTETGRREKTEMDAIHAARKKQHEENTVTAAAPAEPIQIPASRVGNTIHLGPGSSRSSMTSGEVRNMKDFQDRLTVKSYALQWKADDLKAKKVKIAELAKRALELLEKEKTLATGGKSVAAAARASAAISELDAVASVLLMRLMRAIDETSAVKSNTETRYGQIYKAIADSDEQAPANTLSYYADQGA